MKQNPRALCAKILYAVVVNKKTLDQAFDYYLHQTSTQTKKPVEQSSFIKACAYTACRWYFQCDALAQLLLTKPLKPKDQDIYCLIIIGLTQLLHGDTAEHATVSETVNACVALRKPWAKGLINGCLRCFLREKPQLLEQVNTADLAAKYAHPQWFISQLQQSWSEDNTWANILAANNTQAPMSVRERVNNQSQFKQLAKPVDISQLSGFSAGHVSVQDQASQCAAPLLAVEPNQRVLDACAAPGGKTGHLLELEPTIQLTALDISETRLSKVRDNLLRLGFKEQLDQQIKLIYCDASDVSTWWDGQTFDRILLDAPCSGTGVIRRHPDIKLLRQADDIQQFQQQQLALLQTLWDLLKPGGKLLYTTCSVLPTENEQVIDQFIQHKDSAKPETIELAIGTKQHYGWQCFPQINGHDGFYYCLLSKTI